MIRLLHNFLPLVMFLELDLLIEWIICRRRTWDSEKLLGGTLCRPHCWGYDAWFHGVWSWQRRTPWGKITVHAFNVFCLIIGSLDPSIVYLFGGFIIVMDSDLAFYDLLEANQKTTQMCRNTTYKTRKEKSFFTHIWRRKKRYLYSKLDLLLYHEEHVLHLFTTRLLFQHSPVIWTLTFFNFMKIYNL